MASLRNSPYLPLYVDAFVSDEKLNECSASACGVYIRILCLMHKSEDYGRIALLTRAPGPEDLIASFADKLSRHMPFQWQVIYDALAELLAAGVLYIDEDGPALCQKRMIRDARISEQRSTSGRLGMARRYAGNGQGRDSGAQTGTLFEAPAPEPAPEAPARPAKAKPVKVKYADDVRMQEKEYQKLVADYGEELTHKFIDKLNNYKLANHKRYADDYRAILSWVIERVLRDENNQGGNYGPNKDNRAGDRHAQPAGPRDYDETM